MTISSIESSLNVSDLSKNELVFLNMWAVQPAVILAGCSCGLAPDARPPSALVNLWHPRSDLCDSAAVSSRRYKPLLVRRGWRLTVVAFPSPLTWYLQKTLNCMLTRLSCCCFADTVYFHLPPLSGDMKCVYGVSCYRQIEAKVSQRCFFFFFWFVIFL